MRRSFAFAFFLFAAGCECAPPPSGCDKDGDCQTEQMCVDGTCRARSGFDGATPAPDGGLVCGTTQRACGDGCCAEGEICGTNAACCTRDTICGSE